MAVFCTMIGSSDRSNNSEFDRNEPELTGSSVVYWGVMSEDIVGVIFALLSASTDWANSEASLLFKRFLISKIDESSTEIGVSGFSLSGQ